ncbi:MAG: tetratricopeptide repeat protein [Bacteroidota bacterium]
MNRHFLYFLLLVVLIVSCNPTRNRRINRAWHSLTGHYNVYFNGEQKMIEARQTLAGGHPNDFTKVLDVFPYGDENSAKSVSGQMDEVIKKTSLAIQNHTVGKYTDDSYLLMGQAHFLKRDYFAALEAFQYINTKYKDKGLRPISTTWVAKCYAGLKKPDEAEAIMSMHLSEFGPKLVKGKPVKPTLKQRLLPVYPRYFDCEMYATAADIAIRQFKYSTAIPYMENALSRVADKSTRIRYTFILGQLYLAVDSVKQANTCFSKILRMNAPYDFEFNASINIARAYDKNDKSAVKRVRRSLRSMLRDDKNDGMYDQIYYELGNLEFKEKNIQEAIKQYKLSVGKSTKNQNQKALSYLALATVYLEQPDYKNAQAYYDSTAGTISKTYKDYQRILDKKALLSELISHMMVIETQDSLQRLSKLNQEQLQKRYQDWKTAQKLLAEQRLKEEKARKEMEKNAPPPTATPTPTFGTLPGEQAQWYFYNPTTVASGAAEFFSMKKWGKRANEDYWRLSNKQQEKTLQDEGEQQTDSDTANAKTGGGGKETGIAASSDQDFKEWAKDIPYTNEAIERSNEKMINAYYDIGVLYDEKLMDYKEAAISYERMLDKFPVNDFEPEVLYRLYKLYVKQKDETRAKLKKAQLISKYPDNPYALILQNKSVRSAETDANKEIVALYERMYTAYTQAQFDTVFELKKQSEKNFPGNAMRGKFDLLYAMAVGKTRTVPEFKTELELVVREYPKTDLSETAQRILDVLNNKNKPAKDSAVVQQQKEFTIASGGPHYVIIATRDKGVDINEALSEINKYNEEFESLDNLRVNNYLSNEGYIMLMIREFTDLEKAMKYLKGTETMQLVRKRMKFQGDYIQFAITPANFKKMLKEQRIDQYNVLYKEFLETEKTNKPKQ